MTVTITKGFKRFFANTSWMMLERVLRGISVLVVTIYVARYLGPEHFGILNYAISFVGLFAGIGSLGLDNIVIRDLVQDEEYHNMILGTAFILKIIGSIFLFILVLLIITSTSNTFSTKIIVIIIAGGMIFKSLNVIDFYFQASVQARNTAISQFVTVLLSSTFQIALVFLNVQLIWFAIALAIENMIFALLLFVMYFQNDKNIKEWNFRQSIAARLLKDSWPLFFSNLMIMIYMKIDQIMIKEMLNAESLGIYSVAVRLSEAWYIIPMAVTASLFPAVLNARSVSKELYHNRMKNLYSFMFWISLLISIPTILLADDVIRILFGENYILSAGVLKIHIWACIFVFLNVTASKYLLAENLVIITFYQTVAGCVANVFLNILLIPRYGIQGAALATLITHFLIIMVLLHNEKTRIALFLMVNALYPFKRMKV